MINIKIPETCKTCPFYVHDTYNYYRCLIYNKLRQTHSVHSLSNKPEWCKATTVVVDEQE